MINAAAASPALLRHRGPAVVFYSYQEMRARVDDRALDVAAATCGAGRHDASSTR